jgi:ubiquinone/menaquinone biosynthesis C-methylase UbiE
VNQRLLDHYEAKYEGVNSSSQLIACAAVPRNRFEACVRHFPKYFRGGAVLELAAGDGRIARSLLAADLPCSEYTVSDVAQSRLRAAREGLTDPRVRFARFDAEDLSDEPSSRYDAVIMIALIEHLIDPLSAMQQVRRLLRPGGIVYLDTPNIAKYTRRLRLLAGRFPSTATDAEGLLTHRGEPVDLFEEGHLHYFTYKSLTRLLTERCGFTRVEKLSYYEGPRLVSRSCEAALARLWPELFSELCLVARV